MTVKTRQRPYYSKNKKQYTRKGKRKDREYAELLSSEGMEDDSVEVLNPTIWDFADYMVLRIKTPHKII